MCFFKKKKKVAEPVKPVQETSKPEEVAEPKKAASKAKKEEVKVEPKKAEVTYRNYHVHKREDGKWEVKYAGGSKAIKLFATQVEAVEYANTMAKNQDGVVLVHKSKGKNKGKIK